VLHDGEHCSMVRSAKLQRTKLRSRAAAKHYTVELRHWSAQASHPKFLHRAGARTDELSDRRQTPLLIYSRNNRTATFRPLIRDRPNTSIIPFAIASGTSTMEKRSSM